jgi:hypothetical protein
MGAAGFEPAALLVPQSRSMPSNRASWRERQRGETACTPQARHLRRLGVPLDGALAERVSEGDDHTTAELAATLS